MEKTSADPALEQLYLRRQKGNWTGLDTLRKDDDSTARQVLQWTPQHQRKRTTKDWNNQKWDLEKETWCSWRKTEVTVQDGARWISGLWPMNDTRRKSSHSYPCMQNKINIHLLRHPTNRRWIQRQPQVLTMLEWRQLATNCNVCQ